MTRNDCPFGPLLQKYWDRLSPPEKQMKLDSEALYSLAVQEAALKVAKQTSGTHVVDAFCGAGGNAIAFAREGKKVTAIELNEQRLAMAQYNAQLFGVADSITFIHGNSLGLISALRPEALYLAPPWGGPAYAVREKFTLDCFLPNGRELLTLGFAVSEQVIMQVPKNFVFEELDEFGREVVVHEDRLENGDELLSFTVFMASLA